MSQLVSYAHFYGSRGAAVVVNDLSSQACQTVVEEITKGNAPCSSIQ